MDPRANRQEASRIRSRIRSGKALPGDGARLKDLDEAYRNWLRNGGFPA